MEIKAIYKYLSLLTIVSFISCSSNNDKELSIPEEILTKEQYVKILTDLTLAESAANLNIKNVKPEKMDSVYAFNPFSENKISRGKYDSTALFYSQHPQEYKEIYEEVLKQLSEMESKRKGPAKDSVAKKPDAK